MKDPGTMLDKATSVEGCNMASNGASTFKEEDWTDTSPQGLRKRSGPCGGWVTNANEFTKASTDVELPTATTPTSHDEKTEVESFPRVWAGLEGKAKCGN